MWAHKFFIKHRSAIHHKHPFNKQTNKKTEKKSTNEYSITVTCARFALLCLRLHIQIHISVKIGVFYASIIILILNKRFLLFVKYHKICGNFIWSDFVLGQFIHWFRLVFDDFFVGWKMKITNSFEVEWERRQSELTIGNNIELKSIN